MDALTIWFSAIQWASVGQIILFDILLGGDNAVVIALACRGLPPQQRFQGILWGTVGAIVLRVLLVAFAVNLLGLPGVKLAGGLMLLWIGVKLLLPNAESDHEVAASSHVMGAVRTIVVADLVMSVDNVLAIAGAASTAPANYQLYYVVFGMLVSIPFIVIGSQLVLGLIDRYPLVVIAGGAMLGFIAGEMIVSDVLLTPHLEGEVSEILAGSVAAILVVVAARLIKRFNPCQDSRLN
jgi:YjbE family integral membrane protein